MSYRSPCAACEFHGRRCYENCIFAPYFPSTDPERFESVNRIYGARTVGTMLQQTPVHLREDTVETMLFEARARIEDPIYGSVGIISRMQHEIVVARYKIAVMQQQIAYYKAKEDEASIFTDHEQDSLDLEFDDEIPEISSEDDKSEDKKE
ncbi:hypothetical protein MRB53_017321 [Persea americana]|uniref:Uncharacterized protein n=1 Tax=Persea americana TaxID=3435 RepID=A0ACC2M4P2_PERAE|nr:hypothetical protein MRB53_017321 [Persea americana]